MEDFIETVDDEAIKEKLRNAINGRNALRGFKNVLRNYPQEKERWYRFKDAKVKEKVRDNIFGEGNVAT